MINIVYGCLMFIGTVLTIAFSIAFLFVGCFGIFALVSKSIKFIFGIKEDF